MPPKPTSPSPLAIVTAGAVTLAVAMGIGRFAFTPLLPMMLADGLIDLPHASWLASANYLGYLLGALACTFQPWLWARLGWHSAINGPAMVRGGMVATGVLTLAMALPWPLLWPTLRFSAGVTSALVFVYTSGWCLSQLAARGRGALGGAMFVGPGAGIVLSGLLVSGMVALHWRAASGWLLFGALAFALTFTVWQIVRQTPSASTSGVSAAPAASAATPAAASGQHGRPEITTLALAYGLAGFGYIITATFLPVIARGALPGSHWLDLFWPVFGAGVVCGALLSTRVQVSGDLRRALALAYLVQALGIALPLWSPTLAGFALGSLLLGLPFTAITYFAMQEVRRLSPHQTASLMGLLTALYGLGQIIGPPLATWMLGRAASQTAGFAAALSVAGSALVLGALIYAVMVKVFPRR
jgi:MFS family permease